MARSNALAYAALAVVCIVWGTTYLAIRVAVRTIPPFLLTGVRFTTAGAIMLAISLLRGDPFPSSKRILGEIALVGFLLVCLGNLSVVWAEQWVPSGAAALFVATAPFWVAFMERMRADGERMNARRVAGMLMGFAGVALLVTPGGAASAYSSQFVIGALAIQGGCVAWQYGTIRAKYNLGSVPPLMSSAVQMLIGGIAVSAVGLAIGEAPRFQPSREGIVALAYLSIFGAVLTYTAYLYALRDLPTSSVSIYAYVNPLVAVLLGWLILNEELTWISVLAMCVILAGVGLVQMSKPARPNVLTS